MARLVRRRPVAERIKSYLNPLDFLLWLSEEIDANDWDQFEKNWALTLGVILNIAFLIARANSQSSGSRAVDDVFGDEGSAPWSSWFASFVVHLLVCFVALNTFYTFYRKRHYRMFEASIDQTPATPSAHRVHVDSTPVTASPLRYLAQAISSSAQSRAHPSAQRDVWELAVWDPLPISIFLTGLLSVQMSFLSSSFTQQAKDSALVHKEVLKEYDVKYVHPRTQPLMRDVSTQFSYKDAAQSGSDAKNNKVDTFTPTFIVHRGFKTSPNPNYVSHVDPEGLSSGRQPLAATPPGSSQYQGPLQTPSHLRDASPVVRKPISSIRQPQFRKTPTGTGDGGSLGIYSHANSPLRRSTSTSFDRRLQSNADFFYKERGTSAMKRPSSPLKRSNVPGSVSPLASTPRRSQGDARRETGYY
ncbi:hypothetical protein EYZ11_002808 [Aspergillus tanneri]|uniref:Nuclear rim protein 1 n=1 Tax=Aspergillus tanneri TaxID=1220188 RepID=A0A4S3JPY4_9EURO|nr:hypothetical protein EYZ11_002808 [Aspergillus tanneri]